MHFICRYCNLSDADLRKLIKRRAILRAIDNVIHKQNIYQLNFLVKYENSKDVLWHYPLRSLCKYYFSESKHSQNPGHVAQLILPEVWVGLFHKWIHFAIKALIIVPGADRMLLDQWNFDWFQLIKSGARRIGE